MARIRTVKPEMFTSATVTSLTIPARWTFVGLLTYVDDEGRGRADSRLIKGQLWPLDDKVTPRVVEKHLDEMAALGLVCVYGEHFHIVGFAEHQVINRRTASKLPECSRTTHGGLSEPSVSAHGGLTTGKEGKGTEGNGGEGIVPPDVIVNLNSVPARDASGQTEAQVMSA
jgi:hypothetical protein